MGATPAVMECHRMSNDCNKAVFVVGSVGPVVDQVTEGCWFNPCYDGML